MRDPALVFESWKRRGRDTAGLLKQYANLLTLSQEFDLLFVDITTTPGPPVTQHNLIGVPITPEMEARVPGWIRCWYDDVELCSAREAAGDIRE